MSKTNGINFFNGSVAHRLLSMVYVTVFVFQATVSFGQNTSAEYATRAEILELTNIAEELATQLELQLLDKFSEIPEWQCDTSRHSAWNTVGPTRAVPIADLACNKYSREIEIFLTLGVSSFDQSCRDIERAKALVANGRVRPGGHSFFESDDWKVKRRGVNLDGCAYGVLSMHARWTDQDLAVEAGPNLTAELALDIMTIDVTDLASSELFSEHQAVLQELLRSIGTQTDALQAILPGVTLREIEEVKARETDAGRRLRNDLTVKLEGEPEYLESFYRRVIEGWYYIIGRSPGKEQTEIMLAPVHVLTTSPSVVAGLTTDPCAVVIQLSAGVRDPMVNSASDPDAFPSTIDGEDGEISGDYILRNTGRFVGRERIDGTKMEALFHGRLLVRVEFKGRTEVCEENPQVVRDVFERIAQNDLSEFGYE